MRRMDGQGEVLIWCNVRLGEAKDGTEIDEIGTTEHGKTLKRIQVLEDGRVPVK